MRAFLRHDGVIAAVAGVVVLVSAFVLLDGLHGAHWYPASLSDYRVTAFLVAVAIAVVRWAPRSVLCLIAVCVASPWWQFDVPEVRVVPLVVVGFLATSRGAELVVAVPVTIAAALSALFPFWLYQPYRVPRAVLQFGGHSMEVLLVALTLAALLLGASSARRQRAENRLRARNEELIRLRNAETERAALLERTRIAREIHDVIAHHLAAIVIRAQAASRTAAGDAAALEETVGWVATTGQEALSEIRKIVRVLRDSAAQALEPESAHLGEALERIADRVRKAGVHLESAVDIPDLEPIQEFVVLRIAQEALTNVLVHSHADRARLTLSSTTRDFSLRIEDDGASGSQRDRAPVGRFGGNGLPGMRERADSINARLTAGPTRTGWRVELIAPLDLPADRTGRSHDRAPNAERTVKA
jgi:signal transduction histidine kinase